MQLPINYLFAKNDQYFLDDREITKHKKILSNFATVHDGRCQDCPDILSSVEDTKPPDALWR
jgi:hypothetical protein